MDLCAHKSYISNNFKGTISEYKAALHWEVYDYEEFPDEIMEAPYCLNIFWQGEWKCLADLMASCCVVIWGLTFSPLLNCYVQIWKLGND